MIEAGQQAPDFTLPDQDGEPVTLSSLRGGPVVVYFYPKADTPGCTTQACGVRDHQADYDARGATVLGISPDPVKKVKKFHDGQSLNFRLLADEDHAVAEAYDVWAEKSMYGRTYMGNERTTFVIDADGVITDVLRKVKPAEHDDLVLGALGAGAIGGQLLGLDSAIEGLASVVIIGRLTGARMVSERAERRAWQLVAVQFFLLAPSVALVEAWWPTRSSGC